jgi:phage terminase large subunit-like protein
LLGCLSPDQVKIWNRSMGELIMANGSRFKLFSADEPDRLRGYQHHRAWCDELASWRYPDAWDQLLLGLRLGDDPRVIVTTTPRPVMLIRSLLTRDGVYVTRGSTFENEQNLAPAALAQLRERYEGTRMGRQELYADVLEDVPGALWHRSIIDEDRVERAPELQRVVVAIDPAVTSGESADETGIVVAGLGVDGHGYVLADRTCRLSPDGWARRATIAYDEFEADRIIAEVNNGGDLVERVIRTIGGSYAYRAVRASRGKITRAEPVAALYEQHRVHHVGGFAALEDQQCMYTPDGYDGSPDRVDALVWAITELMVGPEQPQWGAF